MKKLLRLTFTLIITISAVSLLNCGNKVNKDTIKKELLEALSKADTDSQEPEKQGQYEFAALAYTAFAGQCLAKIKALPNDEKNPEAGLQMATTLLSCDTITKLFDKIHDSSDDSKKKSFYEYVKKNVSDIKNDFGKW